MNEKRIAHLREKISAAALDGLLVTQNENRYYLTGFRGSAGTVFVTPTQKLLLVDFRYWEQAAKESPNFEIVKTTGPLEDTLPDLFHTLQVKTMGFEGDTVTVSQLDRWKNKLKPPVILNATTGMVENLRAEKEGSEISSIRQAAALTDEAFNYILQYIRPGMTERQIAWELEVYLRTHGSEGVAFEPIVASGEQAALPHARPGERTIREGESILFDFGARVGRYCADLSRTICLGTPPRQLQELHTLVLRAQQAALDGIHAGLTTCQSDALARDVITDAGFSERFGHSLGHGVGLAIHEKPRVSWLTNDTLTAGMVITIEPGVYLPGWGGVRIEDTVVVRANGVEPLSKAPKSLSPP